MGIYGEYSRKFFEYVLKITPLVEPASIDEGYLDITDVCKPEEVVDLAKKIQTDLLEQFKLPCSIGIAPNKFLAKMASEMKKPLGITILRKREIAEKLCNKIAIIKKGQLITTGLMSEVTKNASLEEVFMEQSENE